MSLNIAQAIADAEYIALASGKAPRKTWIAEEENFIIENIGRLTDAEIAERLDRTEASVRVHRVREMLLPAASKTAGYYSAHAASRLLGMKLDDRRKVAHWVDMGLLRGRRMPGKTHKGGKIRIIERADLERFAVNPKNWIYFDIDAVRDARLLRLITLRQQRWGDEWWTTKQAAAQHGVETKDVTRVIKFGWLPAVQTAFSPNGRHKTRRWAPWFVLRSDALAFTFITRKKPKKRFSKATEAWIVKARDEMGWSFMAIGRSTKHHSGELVRRHYYKMKGGKK